MIIPIPIINTTIWTIVVYCRYGVIYHCINSFGLSNVKEYLLIATEMHANNPLIPNLSILDNVIVFVNYIGLTEGIIGRNNPESTKSANLPYERVNITL